MISGIYRISFIGSNKCYYGSSKNVKSRWTMHLSQLRRGVHSNRLLQGAFHKYGEEKIQMTLILSCQPVDMLDKEQKFLDLQFDENRRPIGYNLARKAIWVPEMGQGKWSVEQAEKRDERLRLQSAILAQMRRGMKWSPEKKKYTRRINRDYKKLSTEARRRIGDANKGNQYHLGVKHSEETKRKLSEMSKGRKASRETRLKMSLSQQARQETKRLERVR